MREKRGKERSSRGKERVRYIYIMIDKIVFCVCKVKVFLSLLHATRSTIRSREGPEKKKKRKGVPNTKS